MEYGIQLYSVRDLSQESLEEALRQVARLGYKYVEFAGFFGHSAEEVCRMLRETGLKISGTHTGCDELQPDRLEATIAYHKAIGNPNLIIPGADYSTREKLDELVALINRAQPVLADAGIRLGYHNHWKEFLPTEYGAYVHKELEERTNVEFEIDTYWAYVAKQDPVALLTRLKGRVHVIHLKDGSADGHGTPLGEGTAPVAAVRTYAIANGIRMVVESETCNPSGINEAERCIRYLNAADQND